MVHPVDAGNDVRCLTVDLRVAVEVSIGTEFFDQVNCGRKSFKTAMRSPIVNASIWSWVT
jgi:hypothetical protein